MVYRAVGNLSLTGDWSGFWLMLFESHGIDSYLFGGLTYFPQGQFFNLRRLFYSQNLGALIV